MTATVTQSQALKALETLNRKLSFGDFEDFDGSTDEPTLFAGKAVGKMKKIFEDAEPENFFQHLIFMLQVPLVNGSSKERPNKFDEKILQVPEIFGIASFFKYTMILLQSDPQTISSCSLPAASYFNLS